MMKIAIDIDDVLANLSPILNDFYNRKHRTAFKLEDYIYHDLEKIWGGSKENALRIVEEFFQSSDFAKISIVPHSYEGILTLSQNNTLFSITSRPEILRAQTEKFMNYYFPEIKKIFYTGQYASSASEINKSKICIEEKADVIIDNCLEIIINCAEKGISAFWFDPRDYSNGRGNPSLPKNAFRVKSWLEITEKLK